MSDATLYQNLPLLIPGQALKHITHNEALQTLDILLHCAVDNVDVHTLPESPSSETRFLISDTPATDIADHANTLASYDGVAWTFRQPRTGWRIYDKTTDQSYLFNGQNWQAETDASFDITAPLNDLPGLGIGANADATNVLAVSGPASLFDGTPSHRLHLNRSAIGETASLVFNTGYSGRAEIGLTGSGQDSLSLKVSQDGQAWKTALIVDPTGGLQTGQIRSGVFEVEKDTVQVFNPPVDHGVIIVTTKFNVYPKAESSAIFAFDIGGSPQLVSLSLGPKTRNVDINIPDGTSGPNGFLTVGISVNALHFENRVGPSAQVRYLIIG